MAVTRDDLAGYPKGSFSIDSGYTIELKTKIAWASIDAYAAELSPVTVVVGNQVITSPPAEFYGNPNFRMHSFTWQPLASEEDSTASTDANGLISYEYALFTILYKPIPAEVSASGNDPIPLLQHDGRSSGQFVTMPTAGWKIQNGLLDANPTLLSAVDLPDDIPVGHFFSQSSQSILWKRVVQPPWQALEEHKSYVNHDAFILHGFSFPPESILFTGFDYTRSIQSDGGTEGWDLTLHFETRIVPSADGMGPDGDQDLETGGWNHVYVGNAKSSNDEQVPAGFFRVYNPLATPTVGNIYDDGTVNSIYRTLDFNLLFQAGT
jgi:hypothetical protein